MNSADVELFKLNTVLIGIIYTACYTLLKNLL